MNHDGLIEQFFETLITGDRQAARTLVLRAIECGHTPEDLITEIFWPTYETVERLHRSDQLTSLAHHLATRLLRVLVDQAAAKIVAKPSREKRVLAFCGPTDADEMGAQMAVDLLESQGFHVTFAGGGIANDEILGQVNESQPDILLMFASAPSDLPNIRALIDSVREIGACATMQIAVGGGVFNRAEGLAEEIGADLWAKDPLEMVDRLVTEPARRAEANQRTVGKSRRKVKAA